MCCFDAASLAEAVCGSSSGGSGMPLDIRRVFRVVVEGLEDEEGYAANEDEDDGFCQQQQQLQHQRHEYSSHHQKQQQQYGLDDAAAKEEEPGCGGLRSLVECLWLVLGTWSAEQQRAFIKFVTGSDRWVLSGVPSRHESNC